MKKIRQQQLRKVRADVGARGHRVPSPRGVHGWRHALQIGWGGIQRWVGVVL